MDMTIADLTRFNEFLDATLDPRSLDEEFITSRQVELEDISKNSDGKHLPLIALSYAKLLELTVLLAGRYSDNCQIADFGDLVVNPRHIDVCILNTRLINEDYGITDSIPLWFKRQVRECAGDRYSEDLGRMVVDPALLLHFVEAGLLLRTVAKERHGRLSDQFRYCISDGPQHIERGTPVVPDAVKMLGCGCGRTACSDVASWLASSTVLNIVKGSLKTDLMDVLHEVMSNGYMRSIDKKFEKAFDSLHYVSIARKNFDNFPYNDEVKISEWDEINNTLCHFNLEGYSVIQSELDKSLSSPFYRSPLLGISLCDMPISQDAIQMPLIRHIM
ncbi:hypothetical protein DND132_2849 [Pseudodesulfovibrio mercurii]|uniref:Uncharacterized protein n=1 Tax=Pseudodesulfovibrio mercurii TaxID=641491 RepID=F0JJF3_9BACT|nr:hypothetical protein [Pseudodesulfovibrio mercurii]EGB16052.1 hypothetical protein DND132_2849 [Pseudodesulfovibrio mercurii]